MKKQKVLPPTAYEIDKLAKLTEANRKELAEIKAIRSGRGVVPDARVFKLRRSVKAQIRLERDIARRAAKCLESNQKPQTEPQQ